MLVLSSVLLLLIAGSAAAADETAPVVAVPENVPGADVIVFLGDAYTFDSSLSTDDTRIVDFMWEFVDGGNPVTFSSTTGKVTYTFLFYGQTWVTVYAWDAAGNEGHGYFSIDIVEIISGDLTIRDETRVLDHSYYVEDGDVTIDRSTVMMAEGAGSIGGGEGSIANDFMSESLTPDGEFPGEWGPYYGDPYYGEASLESDEVLSGDYSIEISGGTGNYIYGFGYKFEEPRDLTEWDYFTFWFKSRYTSCYHYMIYIWGDQPGYQPYAYIYNYYNGYQAAYYGWYGMSYSLDFDNVGYSFMYGMTDLSSVSQIDAVIYNGGNNPLWIDHVGFTQQEEPGDPICEGVVNSGGLPGQWYSTSSTAPRTSTKAYVGTSSVEFYLTSSTQGLRYLFNSPQDLSEFDGVRMYTYYSSYYYVPTQQPQFYVYSEGGGYGYYYDYPSKYLNYYASYSYSKWDFKSFPWGPNSGLMVNSNLDWTKITEIRINNVYASTAGWLQIDGLDWVARAGVAKRPTDTVTHAIYNKAGDTTILDSTISTLGATGARIVTEDGSARFQRSNFNNIWSTDTKTAGNGLNIMGGLEVYGDVVADNITFTNCMGPGLALFDGQHTLDMDTIDLRGTALGMKRAPMIILGVTGKTTGQVTMDISGWDLDGSPKGTGMLLMFKDTKASIDVTVTGNDFDANGFAGLVISNHGGSVNTVTGIAGPTADLDITIKDQTVEDCGKYGIVYVAGGGMYDPSVWTTLMMENVTLTRSGDAGFGLWLDAGATNLDATILNSTFERNSGFGAELRVNSLFGECKVDIKGSQFRDNSDPGMAIYAAMAPYADNFGNLISPVASVDITLNTSLFGANADWGIMEAINGWDDVDGGEAPPWTWNGPTRTTLWYNVTMENCEILENAAGGWSNMPTKKMGWINADLVAMHDISDSAFMDNRGSAMSIGALHDLRGGGSASDIYKFDTCRFLDNANGIEHNLGTNNYGYYSEVHLLDCEIWDNDQNSIFAYSYWETDGLKRWGTSRVLGVIYYVDQCRINSPMVIDLIGADDSANPAWDSIMGLQFTNNIIDIEDEPTRFCLEAYPTCDDFTAWAEIGNNRFYRPFAEDGIHLEMFGGWNLAMDVNVFDMKIEDASETGLNFIAGTLVTSPEPHKITGTVMVDNVTVQDAGSNGLNFTVFHKSIIGAKSLALLEVHDVILDRVEHGIASNDMTGAIYDTAIIEPRSSSVRIQYSIFDFYSCDVGPVEVNNIEVLTKGAARLWYDVSVDVRWASGERVVGAVVSVQDNTWSIIAVDTMSATDVISIGYVNSYTILSDSVFSKSPFQLTATYLGLMTEKMQDISSNKVVNLVLVDDVLPRLTVNLPLDDSGQRETTLEIKGHAWDMHSGLKEVKVSIDNGFTWFMAEGAPDFEYTFDPAPEGNLILMVKAVDFAGNERAEHISVLVDATAPTIVIIEPKNDIILTQDAVLGIIGVTEMGATVWVDNVLIPMEHTLFSTDVQLKEGVNEVRIKVSDRLGNTAEHVIKVTMDTIAPPLIVTSPEPGMVLGESFVYVVGQTEARAMVYVNGDMAANLVGIFSHTVVLDEGPNVILITSEDAVGNRATVSMEIVVDTTQPWLQMASPLNGDVFGKDGVNVVGWVEIGSMVTVNDQEVMVDNTHFSTIIMGKEGHNVIVITVADMAGNEYRKTIEVWFDTTPPAIDLWSPMDGLITADETVDVIGQLLWNEDRESFRDITLSINGDFAPFAADGEFRIPYDLVEGTNALFITATDDVGNYYTTSVTVTKDTKSPFLLVKPTPTFDHPTWNKPSTYNGLVYIEGVTEPGSMVTVDGAGVEVDEEGAFNVSILLGSVPEGEELLQRSITVVSTDAAGNFEEETVEVYRLQIVEENPSFMEYESAQYWVLLLSIIILCVAVVATAFLWKRIGARDEYYDDVDDDTYLEEV